MTRQKKHKILTNEFGKITTNIRSNFLENDGYFKRHAQPCLIFATKSGRGVGFEEKEGEEVK